MKFIFLTKEEQDDITRRVYRDIIVSTLRIKIDTMLEDIHRYLKNIDDMTLLTELNSQSISVSNFEELDEFINLLESLPIHEQKFMKVDIKDDFKEIYEIADNNKSHEDIDISLAISALIQSKVTLARASYLADKGIYDFIQILVKYDVPWGKYIEGTLKDEEESLRELKRP